MWHDDILKVVSLAHTHVVKISCCCSISRLRWTKRTDTGLDLGCILLGLAPLFFLSTGIANFGSAASNLLLSSWPCENNPGNE